MGILDQPNTVIVPPASIAANALITEARDVYTRMLSSFTEGARYFWQNPNGLAPQEIADALGAAGVEVAQDVLAETQSAILPLVPYLDTLRWVFIAVALFGIAVAIHARVDDWKRGQR